MQVGAPAAVQPLLRPWPADDLEAVAVSPLVNSPTNGGPECLAPAESGPGPT